MVTSDYHFLVVFGNQVKKFDDVETAKEFTEQVGEDHFYWIRYFTHNSHDGEELLPYSTKVTL